MQVTKDLILDIDNSEAFSHLIMRQIRAALLPFFAQFLFVYLHNSLLRVAALGNAPTGKPSRWGGWRIAFNVGREPFTTMPRSWASTGARFPFVVKCNFTDDGQVLSISGNVRYTIALEGEVVKPVQSGSWSLKNDRHFTFSLKFPEEMKRNGVELGPCEIICEGLLYTKNDLDALNRDFYEARSVTDNINAEVKEARRQREAPKKWNFETDRWEKRYQDESIVATVGKRLKQFKAGIVEESKSKKRPKPLELSLESGQFPGINCGVYIKKGGTIKLKGGGVGDAIIGTWGAEPINDNPASYYRPSY